jgi:hypothetical protein
VVTEKPKTGSLAGGQHRTLTLPVPEPAWKIRQTPAGTITEIDRLLDHHTCAEIAGILRRRGLANGEGRPFTPTMVHRVIRTYQLALDPDNAPLGFSRAISPVKPARTAP